MTRALALLPWLAVYLVSLVAIAALIAWGGWRFVAGTVTGATVLALAYYQIVLRGRGPRG